VESHGRALIREGDTGGSATVEIVLTTLVFVDVLGPSQIGFVALSQITVGRK